MHTHSSHGQSHTHTSYTTIANYSKTHTTPSTVIHANNNMQVHIWVLYSYFLLFDKGEKHQTYRMQQPYKPQKKNWKIIADTSAKNKYNVELTFSRWLPSRWCRLVPGYWNWAASIVAEHGPWVSSSFVDFEYPQYCQIDQPSCAGNRLNRTGWQSDIKFH